LQGLQLDRAHRNIWISFALIIIFGFTAFVKVKGDVIKSRKAEMAERERIRKELNLTGERRKAVSIV
uniref:MFS transporter n=1 Tax=Ascaris lumbricoides TaxID=6252 RepID=A0A0M3IXR3_ASCLU